MTKVLFLCRHNAGRSRMATAFFNELADPARALGLSAGTEPADRVYPVVITAMAEAGFDLGRRRPIALATLTLDDVSLIVSMGCGEACASLPAVRALVWDIADPRDQSIEVARTIRDEVRELVRGLVAGEGWERPAQPLQTARPSRRRHRMPVEFYGAAVPRPA